MGNKPSTPEGWSSRVQGSDKVKRNADDWRSIPEQDCTGILRMYPDEASCNIFYAQSLYPVLPGVMALAATMTIHRASNGDLTLFNVFRLPARVEDELLALGRVAHIVKLGQFHGAGDAYYMKSPRFETPVYWAHVGASVAAGLSDARVLTADALPITGSRITTLQGPYRESVVTVPAASGRHALVTTDALVHLTDELDEPFIGRMLLSFLGHVKKNVPAPAPIWLKHVVAGSGKEEVRRWFQHIMNEMEWQDVITAHGDPVLNCARESMRESIAASLASYK